MNNALEVRALCKRYEGFVLDNINFELPEGYIMGLIGPNGSGKTTTIKGMLGMITPDSGSIGLFGEDGRKGLDGKIGVVMDSPFFSDDWSMTDIEAAVAPFYDEWDKARFARLLEEYGIDRKKKVKELSRGMKVKLMLAVAFSHGARLLILDEPTSGLDPAARDELCGMLGEFVGEEDKSVLFSTHITSDLERIADYITFILDGKLIFTGPKEDLLERYLIVKGGPLDIAAAQRALIIGLREHSAGFEGMIAAENAALLSKTLLIEPVTLDDIIVYMNRGRDQYE